MTFVYFWAMATNICLKHNLEKRESWEDKNTNLSQQLGCLGEVWKCLGKSDAINSNTYLIMGLAGQFSLGHA